MFNLLKGRGYKRKFDNSVDAFNPQFWANESLAILEETMVMGNLVHRDFEPIIQNYGDTINTRRVGEFEAKRKHLTDNVTIQDATATNVEVKLNHHVHVSFLIRDGEESKAITSLVDDYMAPAMIGQARYVDKVLSMQVYRYLKHSYGRLGNMSSADVVERITGVRNLMNVNKNPMGGRNVVLTPGTETTILRNSDFVDASFLGDDGTALREASLGRAYGLNFFMAQNTASVPAGNTVVVGAVNSAGGHAVGATSLTVDGLSAAITNGTWITVDGDNVPQRVTGTTGGATPTAIAITPGLKHAVVDDAPVRIYTPGAVNNASGYAKGWAKEITVDGFSVAPKVGQMVAFGTATDIYGIIAVSGTTGITLDRPLDAAIADDDKANIGPPGDYNFAFQRNALAMVVRPLATPRVGTGALSSVVNLNGLSIRCVITYNGDKQGHLVTIDMLMGVAVLDVDQGAVLLA